MKKKTVVAMLALCMALSAAACGKESSKKEPSDTQDTADTQEEKTAEKESSEEEIRIVSVDDVSDYVKIGKYIGLELDRYSTNVTDEYVETQIGVQLEDAATEVADGTVQAKDTIRINYSSTSDGEAVADGTVEDYDLLIGNAVFGEDFDNAMIGMKPGETKDVSITYADDYYDEDVAGKTVDYTVTLQTITRAAELTDDWVKANTDYQTVDEYRAGVKAELEQYEKDNADLALYADAWDQVVEDSEIKDVPEEDLNKEEAEYKNLNEKYLAEAGTTLEDFLEAQGMDNEDYEEECLTYALEKVEQNLIVQGIMDAEGLSLDDDVCEELKSLLLQNYGYESMDDLIDYYGEDEVNESLALLRVERYIVEQATVNEVTGDEESPAANEGVYDDGTDGETTETTDTSAADVETIEDSGETDPAVNDEEAAAADTASVEAANAEMEADGVTDTAADMEVEAGDPGDGSETVEE